MKRNRKRAIVCNRTVAAGFNSPRWVADVAGVTVTRVADALLNLADAAETHLLEGKAKFTGNTRTYRNGAVASEIRCGGCGLTFWETGLPYAMCVDCRGMKRKVTS